jgi:2-oxoglutarate ferredoxin oxidoreductase subunit alpha
MQMEDELASIHSVGGASCAGVKAMTASSGPGIGLKLEGLGWGIKNEIPYVLVDVQRAGPSNGVATRVAQGDFYTIRYGSPGGNYSIIALSPKSVQEAFDLTIECFNLSEVFRCPVVLLTDEVVGHTREKLTIPDASKITIIHRKKPEVPPEEFIMYPLDDEAAIHYPFPSIGEGYGICVSPYTHNERGYPSVEKRDQERMARRLTNKIMKNMDKLNRVEKRYIEDAKIAVIGYGCSARPALAAVDIARENGLKVGFLRPIIVWPFPEEEIYRVAQKVDLLLVVELNVDGQMSREVARAAKGRAEVYHLGSGGVETHLPDEIWEALRRLMR